MKTPRYISLSCWQTPPYCSVSKTGGQRQDRERRNEGYWGGQGQKTGQWVVVGEDIVVPTRWQRLWPLVCWDCGFERPGNMDVCLLWMLRVAGRETSATGWSLVQRIPTDRECSLFVITCNSDLLLTLLHYLVMFLYWVLLLYSVIYFKLVQLHYSVIFSSVGCITLFIHICSSWLC
jgi:hypothetical protein